MRKIDLCLMTLLALVITPSFAQTTGVCIDANGSIVKVCETGGGCDKIKGYQSVTYTNIAAGQSFTVYTRKYWLAGKYKLIGTVQAQEGQTLAWSVLVDSLKTMAWETCNKEP